MEQEVTEVRCLQLSQAPEAAAKQGGHQVQELRQAGSLRQGVQEQEEQVTQGQEGYPEEGQEEQIQGQVQEEEQVQLKGQLQEEEIQQIRFQREQGQGQEVKGQRR